MGFFFAEEGRDMKAGTMTFSGSSSPLHMASVHAMETLDSRVEIEAELGASGVFENPLS